MAAKKRRRRRVAPAAVPVVAATMAATAATTSEHDALDDAGAKRWRLVWAGSALVGLGLTAVSSVPLAITAQTVCGELPCANGQITQTAAAWLVDHGIAVSTWVTVLLALRWMIMLAMVAGGAWALWAGPRRRITVILALLGLAAGAQGFLAIWQPTAENTAVAPEPGGVLTAAAVMVFAANAVLQPLALGLFPDGMWYRPWVRWSALVVIGFGLIEIALGVLGGQATLAHSVAGYIATLASFAVLVGVVQRWRRATDGVVRRQMSALVTTALVLLGGSLLLIVVLARGGSPLAWFVIDLLPTTTAFVVGLALWLVCRPPRGLSGDLSAVPRAALS